MDDPQTLFKICVSNALIARLFLKNFLTNAIKKDHLTMAVVCCMQIAAILASRQCRQKFDTSRYRRFNLSVVLLQLANAISFSVKCFYIVAERNDKTIKKRTT